MDRVRKIARRLLKSLARQYVYQAATASGAAPYQSLLEIEESLTKEARTAWLAELKDMDPQQREELPNLVGESLVEAVSDVRQSLDPLHVSSFLGDYVANFCVDDLLSV